MGDYGRGQLDLDDEDRLPWLQPAEDDDADEGVSPLKLLGLILAGLLLLGAIVGAIWWMRDGTPSADEGQLIAAPTESYKIAANEADAKKFDGEGDASFAASEGVDRDGKIDPARVAEAPITATGPAATKINAPATKPSQSVTAKVTDQTAPTSAPPAARPASGGALIQLGAYGSQSGAKDAWTKLSKRFSYLEPLAMIVEPAEVGGSTVYRLRASAGAQASTICGKLKVAGESCMLVK